MFISFLLPTRDRLSYLEQAIETVHATIELAARQGLAQARIALQPAELGEIRIHLTQTAAGLVARVTAETPAAAQALAAGHAELRQSLSSLGLTLTRLDIGHHDQSAANGSQHGGHENPNGQGTSRSGAGTNRSTGIEDPEATAAEPAAEAQTPPAGEPGALVDVLA